MARQLIQVYLPIFWVRSCYKDFQKTAQIPLVNSKEVEHKDTTMLLGKTFQKIFMAKVTVIVLL